MKIVYLGSDVAISVLDALNKSEHEIVAVVCNVDKPNARGNKIVESKTKRYAIENNLKVLQYKKIRTEGYEDIKALQPDLIISAAFGQIISQEIIDISKVATLNVHPSLLPKYRGPSPIISSILNGDVVTGVSIMQMALEVDAGPVYKQQKVEIFPNETAGQLTERLFVLGAKLLLQTISEIENKTYNLINQKSADATFCKMIKEEDCKLNFSLKCDQLNNIIRAFNPTPVAFFTYKDNNFKVFESEVVKENSLKYKQICENICKFDFKNGEIVFAKPKPFGLVIKCEDGFILPKIIQAPNCKIVDIKSYLNGKTFEVGEILWKNVC